MERHIFSNGIKLYYVGIKENISSFCIGFNSGALVEEENELGLAHAVEHMLFKGTKKRNEKEINTICDEVFGFHNAMTNYPYAIYYGTTLSCDFEKGFEVYADIILNPTFPNEGFREEMNIILEELNEWKDDPYQDCEDELFFNAFSKRRIRYPIIGREPDIKNINLKKIKDFYNKHYAPSNCVITVASSLDYNKVIEIVDKYFSSWKKDYNYHEECSYEMNNPIVCNKHRKDLNGAKIEYLFPMHFLSQEEIFALKVFSAKFGEGLSSILYDEIRTKKGLVYDITSKVKDEKGIKLFTIRLGTSEKNIENAIEIIEQNIEKVKNSKDVFTVSNINKIMNNIYLKNELAIERSIELCKKYTTNEIMYNSPFTNFHVLKGEINEGKILEVINKVLKNPTIQVLRP